MGEEPPRQPPSAQAEPTVVSVVPEKKLPELPELQESSRLSEVSFASTSDLGSTISVSTGMPHIEVDSSYDTDGGDSAFDESWSDTTSLASLATDYVFENGRRYHGFKEGRYMLPNDEQEMDREDMKHHISMLLTEGRLTLAPIGNKPQRILDIGTGTGIWAVQMADEYESAEVIATDLSPIQPQWVPPNLKFEIDDAEAEWLYEPDSIDLVHARYMFHGIRDWPKLCQQAYTALRPGGWIELIEFRCIPTSYDRTLPPSSMIMEFYTVLQAGGHKIGLDFDVCTQFSTFLSGANFVNVHERIFDLPIGPWPKDKRLKEIGLFNMIQVTEGLQAIAMGLLTRVMGWSRESVEVWLAGVRNEMKDRGVHSLWKCYFVLGQKPLDS